MLWCIRLSSFSLHRVFVFVQKSDIGRSNKRTWSADTTSNFRGKTHENSDGQTLR
jgi:hypothetical protein